jgi:hypothetical protein
VNPGGWRSVAGVMRYEHASEERNALLAEALNPSTLTEKCCPHPRALPDPIAHLARTTALHW